MKATIKATGEIVEIKDLYDDGTALVGNMYIKVSELNFFSENIDGEQRRYELAKDIIKIVIANDYGVNSDVVAKYSLNCADALIKRLKENNYEQRKTQTLSINGDGGGEAYIDFCDGQLCVSVVIEGKQADFHFEPVTLKMFAHAYKLHCEECEKKKGEQS